MAGKNPVAATFSKLVNNITEVERLDAINKAHDEKLSALEQVFAQADENMGVSILFQMPSGFTGIALMTIYVFHKLCFCSRIAAA